MKIECRSLSRFPDEKETLFFGGDTKLKIKRIKQSTGKRWADYASYLNPINAFNHLLSGQPLKGQAILSTQKHRKVLLLGVISDFLNKLISQSAPSKIPEYIWKLMWFTHSETPQVRLLYDELMVEYDWVHCILKSDKCETIDLANIAVLCCKSKEIVVEMNSKPKFLRRPEWKSLTQGMNKIQELGLSMKVRFQLWPTESDWNRMYNMALPLAKEHGITCQKQERGKVLLFSVNGEQYRETDSATVAFDDRVRNMIERLSEADELLRAPKEPENVRVEQRTKVMFVTNVFSIRTPGQNAKYLICF